MPVCWQCCCIAECCVFQQSMVLVSYITWQLWVYVTI